MDGPRVLDEHVKPVMAGGELAGEGAHRVQILKIGQAIADSGAAGRRRDAAPGPLRPALVAGQEVDRRAAAGQRDGGRLADPGRSAGDEDGLPVGGGGVPGGELGPQGGPDGQADPGKSGNHGELQCSVHGQPTNQVTARAPAIGPPAGGTGRPAGGRWRPRWRCDARTQRPPGQGQG